MRLTATAIGYGVAPDSIAGPVIAVFPRACEILCADGLIVTLSAVEGGVPGGISVEVGEGFRFDAHLVAGAEAAVRGGVLRFAGSVVSIDLRGASAWRSRLGEMRADFALPEPQRARGAAVQALLEDGRTRPLVAVGRGALIDLVRASRSHDIDAAAAAAAKLIGLGDGVTPAGDDCLVGHLCGLWAGVHGRAGRIAFAEELGRRVAALAPRTHRVSRAYLEAAAVGEASQKLARLAMSIARGDEADARGAAAAAIAVGHSSGACMVLGLLLGTAAASGIDLESGLID